MNMNDFYRHNHDQNNSREYNLCDPIFVKFNN